MPSPLLLSEAYSVYLWRALTLMWPLYYSLPAMALYVAWAVSSRSFFKKRYPHVEQWLSVLFAGTLPPLSASPTGQQDKKKAYHISRGHGILRHYVLSVAILMVAYPFYLMWMHATSPSQ